MPTAPSLKRAFSLPLLTFYGLGTILGAGIYVLIGEVAGKAGMLTPVAFLLAAILAGFSACSYAELASRFPLSAGEAVYAQRAFGRTWVALLLGFMIVMIGVVSTATLVNGFTGYLQLVVRLPDALAITLLLVALTALAMWGIRQSAWIAAGTTLIVLAGLLLILGVGLPKVQLLSTLRQMFAGVPDLALVGGVLGGAFVAFYAFIGFEDIVNVAEEVREPSRTVPRALLLALAVASVLYMLTALVAISLVEPQLLALSAAPLGLVYQDATGRMPFFITITSLAAVINSAIVQIVMASRVLYGMASQGWISPALARINPTTRTPLRSTALVGGGALVLALWLPLGTLAEVTSLITLLVFSLVNLSLWRIKRRDPAPVEGVTFPVWVPLAGFVFSFMFVLFQLGRWIGL